MFRYALTIFLSAFLLFQVQPMIAKFILPWFGGTASVWTTCMLFFQIALLAGYCYSHLITKRLSLKQQWILHAILLVVAFVFLPVQPSEVWKPVGSEDPTWQMLLLLSATIGFPFFMLSTTGPLIQAWQSRTHSQKSAYRLFAVSNFGSLLGLLGYPFIVEPYLRLGDQSLYWSIGFVVFGLLCLWSGWQLFAVSDEGLEQGAQERQARHPAGNPSGLRESDPLPIPGLGNCIFWTLLAFAASSMLLATTNQMCQEVASVPFLWVLPLGLYLITFIICFENPRWYRREIFFPLMFLSVLAAIFLLKEGVSIPLPLQVVNYALVMFACCMTCHGELAKSKPAVENLTLFYLMVSIGGALGGIFVVIVAPRIFTVYFEFHVSLILSVALSVLAMLMRWTPGSQSADASDRRVRLSRVFAWLAVPIAVAGIGATINCMFEEGAELGEAEVLYRTRNSYGTLHVRSYLDEGGYEESRSLINGRIKHGAQRDYGLPSVPVPVPSSYYSSTSGIGVAVDLLGEINDDGPLRFGVVGLGTGSMASWGIKGDSFKFYEINPACEFVAREYFSYLSNTEAFERVEVVIGDARVQMENYLAEHGSEEFDLLVVDAFSSDAIPMHLLTRECFQLYCDNLSERGILAVHVSNRYLNLGTIVFNLANEIGYESFLVETYEDSGIQKMIEDFDNGADESSWVLVTRDPQLTKWIRQAGVETPWPEPMPTTVWTDDFGSLNDVVDWSDTYSFAADKWEELLTFFTGAEVEEYR